jgi:hypothetical protein
MIETNRHRPRHAAATLALLGVVAALGLTFGAGAADAHKRLSASNVQIKADAVSDTSLALSGKLTSDHSRCVANRTVTVTANGAFVASAVTLVNGDWSVVSSTRPPKGTTLVATVGTKFLKRSKKHRHKCGSDFSERRAP